MGINFPKVNGKISQLEKARQLKKLQHGFYKIHGVENSLNWDLWDAWDF